MTDTQVNSDNISEGKQTIFEASKKRWLILSIYCVLQVVNASLWTTYSPISDVAQDYFGGKDTVTGSITSINMLATSYQIFYGPGTWLASEVMKMYGLRNTMLIAGYTTSIGAASRLIGALLVPYIGNGGNYSLQLLGQCLAALVQPLLLNLVAALSSTWFPLSERDTATTISTLFNPIGSAVGQILPSLFVSQSSDGTVHGMEYLLLVELIFCVLPCIAAWAFFDAAPSVPPSRSVLLKLTGEAAREVEQDGDLNASYTSPLLPSAPPLVGISEDNYSHHSSHSQGGEDNIHHRQTSIQDNEQTNDEINEIAARLRTSLMQTHPELQHANLHDASSQLYKELHRLYHDRNYVILLLAFSMGIGLFNAIVTLLNQILDAQGYSNDDAGNFGAVLIVCGVIGAGIFGWLMERTHAYRPLLKASFGLLVGSFVFFLFMLRPNNDIALLFSFALLGFFLLGLLPVAIENAAEVAYPVDEEVSVGLLFLGGNTIGIAYVFVIQALLESSDGHYQDSLPWLPSNMFMLGFVFICFLLVLLYQGKYKRLLHEKAPTLLARDKEEA